MCCCFASRGYTGATFLMSLACSTLPPIRMRLGTSCGCAFRGRPPTAGGVGCAQLRPDTINIAAAIPAFIIFSLRFVMNLHKDIPKLIMLLEFGQQELLRGLFAP